MLPDQEKNQLAAYSPMAMGTLSGKYHLSDNCGTLDARMYLFRGRYSEGYFRYKLQSPKVKAAVKEYTQISARYDISSVTLAIAFVFRHSLVAAAVLGATKLWQQLFSVRLNCGSLMKFFRQLQSKIYTTSEATTVQDLYYKRTVKYVGEAMTHLESIASSVVRTAIKVKA